MSWYVLILGHELKSSLWFSVGTSAMSCVSVMTTGHWGRSGGGVSHFPPKIATQALER